VDKIVFTALILTTQLDENLKICNAFTLPPCHWDHSLRWTSTDPPKGAEFSEELKITTNLSS